MIFGDGGEPGERVLFPDCAVDKLALGWSGCCPDRGQLALGSQKQIHLIFHDVKPGPALIG